MYGVETCDSHNVKVKVIFTIVEMLFGALRAVSTVGARAFSSAPPSVCLVLQWLSCCNIHHQENVTWKSKYVTLFWKGKSFQVWALGRLNHVAIAVPDLQVVGTSRQAFFIVVCALHSIMILMMMMMMMTS